MPIKIRVSEEWDVVSGTAVGGGSEGNIQFNDGGNLNGSNNLTWNKTTNLLQINQKININSGGAFGVGSGPDFGALGKLLFSQGSGDNPIWDNLVETPIIFNFDTSSSTIQQWESATATTKGTFALVACWGGGGSGGGNNYNEESGETGDCGGGGGGCALGLYRMSDLVAMDPIYLRVGGGGARKTSDGSGYGGADSMFGTDASGELDVFLLKGEAGGGGPNKGSGGIGGSGFVNKIGADNNTAEGFDLSLLGEHVFEGGKGAPSAGEGWVYTATARGASTLWGGAGGASGNYGGQVPGTSVWGGNGSLGVLHGGNSPNGQVPGGGGAGRAGDTLGGGGAGAAGQVKIWIFG
jgi:hyaluronate lyase